MRPDFAREHGGRARNVLAVCTRFGPGASIDVVSEHLGHADVVTTLTHHARLRQRRQDQAVKAMEAIVARRSAVGPRSSGRPLGPRRSPLLRLVYTTPTQVIGSLAREVGIPLPAHRADIENAIARRMR